MRLEKALALLIGVVAAASLLGQGHMLVGLTAEKGGHLGLAIWVFFGFFTILTNGLVALACLARARGVWPLWWPSAKMMLACLALNLVLVAMVYHLLLSRLWNPVGLHWWADQGLHSAVPGLFLAYWALFAPKAGLVWRDALRWLVYPAGYFAYALARGAVDGWYPYPFLDVGKLGYGVVLANALVMTALLVGAGLAMVAASRVLPQGRA